jgi:hypothetical protein
MKAIAHFALVLIVTAGFAFSTTTADKPALQDLRARADAAQGQLCAEVCVDAAAALVESADKLFTEGNAEQGHQQMKDAVSYAERATKGSIQSNKRQKKTEIGLRKLSRRMTEIRQTLAIDDRPPMDDLINSVEKMRTALLMSMFDEKK